MEPAELLVVLARALDQLSLRYFVTGSMATIFYGEPRFTNDIDVVIALGRDDAARLCQSFPPSEFYCSEPAARDAAGRGHMFNILHPKTGLKIDVMVPDGSAFNQSRFERRRLIAIAEDANVWFASPEDVLLKKMISYREGGSEKHIRDILGVLKIQGTQIDLGYIGIWASRLDLVAIWDAVREELEKPS